MLFKLKLPESAVGYDCYDGFVVRAQSEDEARALAADEAADEGARAWLDVAACESLEAIGESGIVLGSFNAG